MEINEWILKSLGQGQGFSLFHLKFQVSLCVLIWAAWRPFSLFFLFLLVYLRSPFCVFIYLLGCFFIQVFFNIRGSSTRVKQLHKNCICVLKNISHFSAHLPQGPSLLFHPFTLLLIAYLLFCFFPYGHIFLFIYFKVSRFCFINWPYCLRPFLFISLRSHFSTFIYFKSPSFYISVSHFLPLYLDLFPHGQPLFLCSFTLNLPLWFCVHWTHRLSPLLY